VTTQSEYATDLVFKSRPHLEFLPRLLAHSTLCFSARDVMIFLGRKWRGNFEGEAGHRPRRASPPGPAPRVSGQTP
jgi:hypothetical protein